MWVSARPAEMTTLRWTLRCQPVKSGLQEAAGHMHPRGELGIMFPNPFVVRVEDAECSFSRSRCSLLHCSQPGCLQLSVLMLKCCSVSWALLMLMLLPWEAELWPGPWLLPGREHLQLTWGRTDKDPEAAHTHTHTHTHTHRWASVSWNQANLNSVKTCWR